ncbi:hypothetical protein AVEN_264448-1 [Araneus ventricosus]|uniref:Uncharacterized protein n=1 Tax=Araneus ventricosus TaxID=182803 RepID=A0A4Y2K7J8_ARAVE|nr:hypothetical protein AVEN_264448-1 [Araneus ventricosus]
MTYKRYSFPRGCTASSRMGSRRISKRVLSSPGGAWGSPPVIVRTSYGRDRVVADDVRPSTRAIAAASIPNTWIQRQGEGSIILVLR